MSFEIDWRLFGSVFALIFVAELPDKTALATILMATRARPVPIFVGVALAFVVQTIIAVAFGSVFATLPQKWVHLAAGLLFIGFAIAAWLKAKSSEEEEAEGAAPGAAGFWPTVGSSFLVIFIAEWGDLTQLASASLVARYRAPLTIFFSAVLALWAVTALAILVGNRAKHFVNPRKLQRVAAVAFAGVGIYFLYEMTR